MPTKKLTVSTVAAMAGLLALLLVSPAALAATAGTWELYPPQTTTYTTAVQQPINADGSSSWPSKRGVIPVQFSLLTSPGPVVFQSIYTDNPGNTDNDYSYLSFTPGSTLLFNQITNLSANYNFTLGNCHGGSLRWSVRVSATQSVFIYYGGYPNFTDCTAVSQSGTNMISLSDLRYDTSQVGGTFYDNYAGAVALVGSSAIVRVSLVIDSGWGGDQTLNVSNVTVNDNTFVPAGGPPVATCSLPQAAISVTKVTPATLGISEVASIQPADNNLYFRVVDCKYIYNLDVSTLAGSGTYSVQAVIGGASVAGTAFFSLK